MQMDLLSACSFSDLLTVKFVIVISEFKSFLLNIALDDETFVHLVKAVIFEMHILNLQI